MFYSMAARLVKTQSKFQKFCRNQPERFKQQQTAARGGPFRSNLIPVSLDFLTEFTGVIYLDRKVHIINGKHASELH